MNFSNLAFHRLSWIALASLVSTTLCLAQQEVEPFKLQHEKAQAAYNNGNYKDAFELYKMNSLRSDGSSELIALDIHMGQQCLGQLGMIHESDAWLESLATLHSKDWRVLHAISQIFRTMEHEGYVVSGKFERGFHRGEGEYGNCWERDRRRALQLMDQAVRASTGEVKKAELATLYHDYAHALQYNRFGLDAFLLQELTDLTNLPDFEPGYGYYGRMVGNRGAPVDADGNPVYHLLPESWESAKSDGERWRWLLLQAKELNPAQADEIDFEIASFAQSQFGVQTMAYYGANFLNKQTGSDSNPYILHLLPQTETIARLATGVKRFKPHPDYDFVATWKRLFESKGSSSTAAAQALAQTFQNRRQYAAAAEWWKRAGDTDAVQQILGNFGTILPAPASAAGEGASFGFKFRNAKSVTFKARALNIELFLNELKAHLKSSPKQLDWARISIEQLGYQLIENQSLRLLGPETANWKLSLSPPASHFDQFITVQSPIQEAGAYWIESQIEGGNKTFALLWVHDTAIVSKPTDNNQLYFVADAASGKPVVGANLEFIGYRVQWVQNNGGESHYRVDLSNFAEKTDAEGLVLADSADLNSDFNWLAVARDGKRLAIHGFSRIWFNQRYPDNYQTTKVFPITDRPVYRPGQKVFFKFWIRDARYDLPLDQSAHAGQSYHVQANNAKGETIYENRLTTDAYGGLNGELSLPEDAALGVYSITLPGIGGGLNFRVEEYKKPEFEVTVEAPSEPIALGESFSAKIQAKYYFGSPVSSGKVKLRVLRSPTSANWYPPAPWDWFYGPGYWWFSPDLDWHPGFRNWGCKCPLPFWLGVSAPQPEIVLENETKLNPDGSLEVKIDTALAKMLHGDQDHSYRFEVEVTDESRRTITGGGSVLAARKPFKVFAWVDKGYYRSGEAIEASFAARSLDNKPVSGKGLLKLLRITTKDDKVLEEEIQNWSNETDSEGRANLKLKAAAAGQYRISYSVTDSKGRSEEGAYVFSVVGEEANDGDFQFNDLELIQDKREYAVGDTVKLLINTRRARSTVLLFMRPSNGIYPKPQILEIKGKSRVFEFKIEQADMPNFFIEAMTISSAQVHSITRELIVPPSQRSLDIAIQPTKNEFLPGEEAEISVLVKDESGKPYAGSLCVTIYDRALEYISGGSNVEEIRSFFWKSRRYHRVSLSSSLRGGAGPYQPSTEIGMSTLGLFGDLPAPEAALALGAAKGGAWGGKKNKSLSFGAENEEAKSESRMKDSAAGAPMPSALAEGGAPPEESNSGGGGGAEMAAPAIRKNFADTAYWNANLQADAEGRCSFKLKMPENLSAWSIKSFGMGHGTRVGQASAEVVTRKNVMIRLQAPRFFVETDEVVLSGNVHNYLDSAQDFSAVLELDGPTLALIDPATATQNFKIGPKEEKRVDWRVKVLKEGEAIVRMKALSKVESDGVEQKFPVYVHGITKTVSFSGVVRPEAESAFVTLKVPAERKVNDSKLIVRFSPSLAGAMVDALPYMVEFPYGCTEQTLNRFLPTVITQKILMDMKLDLAEIEKQRSALNAQEIGDPSQRKEGWKRWDRNPVFSNREVSRMSKEGLKRLTEMQCSDGGWGWFSGYGEQSWPHTTATVVRGLLVARNNDLAIVPGVLERGLTWLANYQSSEVALLDRAPSKKDPYKTSASDTDALVFWVLVKGDNAKGEAHDKMKDYLYRDRKNLSVYALSMLGMAYHKLGDIPKRDMLIQNIEQYLKEDPENQTAWLELPNGGYWWYWYGSEYETLAYYLKLLAMTNPKSTKASGLVKYLLNNRKHATYWNSTRDTALCLEAMADYMRASGEDQPDMTVEVFLDGRKLKEAKIDRTNLFTFDGTIELQGDAIETGEHKLELRRKGKSPVYFNAYLSYFSKEDLITKAGLEVKVERQYYKLEQIKDATSATAGSRGQVLKEKVLKYNRIPLANGAELESGDLVEIELSIESKNDYEYLIFEDLKAAGFEPVDVRSGYINKGPARLHGAARRKSRIPRSLAGPRQAQRELPHARRDPRKIQRPPHLGLGHVCSRDQSQRRRAQASNPRLIRLRLNLRTNGSRGPTELSSAGPASFSELATIAGGFFLSLLL
jgi:uncharacterized protein YfaS (alpha-2-macroglobulin family)